MGTKENPGEFDCHANAGDDEPIFTLRAKDPAAPAAIRAWVEARKLAKPTTTEREQFRLMEAMGCAMEMEAWRQKIDPMGSTPIAELDFMTKIRTLAECFGLTREINDIKGSADDRPGWLAVLKGKTRLYRISAYPVWAERSAYLGCQMTVIGNGGRDCADGDWNDETWKAIVADVATYEIHGARTDMVTVR